MDPMDLLMISCSCSLPTWPLDLSTNSKYKRVILFLAPRVVGVAELRVIGAFFIRLLERIKFFASRKDEKAVQRLFSSTGAFFRTLNRSWLKACSCEGLNKKVYFSLLNNALGVIVFDGRRLSNL